MWLIKIFFILLLKVFAGKITIHLIPFTRISNLTKPFNYSNVINDLNENLKRTFVILNPVQFEKWYTDNNYSLSLIKDLIKNKQLEFIIDGINEEREKDNYLNLISGIRRKINFIINTLNSFPTVSFFLSQESTSLENLDLYRKIGFKYLILNKLNIQFKNELITEKDLEFKWKVSKEDKNGFFTHIINEISTPEFLKDFSSDKEMNLSKNSILENYTKNLIEYANKTLSGFKHNNLLFLFGGYDTFAQGKFNFENIEKLINYINQNKYKDIIEIYYSTFENYFHFSEQDLRNQSILIFDKHLPLSNDYKKKWINFYVNNPYLRGREYEINNFMNSLFIFNNDLFIGKKTNTLFDSIQKSYLEKINMILSINSQEQLFNDYEKDLKQNLNNLIQNYYNESNNELIVCLSNNKVNLGCKIEFPENKKSHRLGIINPGLDGKILITLETNIMNENVTFRLEDSKNKVVQFNFVCIPNYKCYINFFYTFYKTHSIIQISIVDIKTGNINNKQKFDNSKIELKGFDTIFKKFEFNSEDSSFYVVFKHKKTNSYNFSINEVLLNSGSNDLFSNNNINKYKINYQESFIINSEISKSLLLFTENDYLLFNIYNSPFFIQIVSLIFENIDNNKMLGLVIDSNINNEGKIYHDYQGIKMQEYNINYNNNINDNIFVVHKALSLFSKENNQKITLFIDRPNIGVSHKEGSLMYILTHKNEIVKNEKLEFRFILTIDEIFHEDVNKISKNYFEKNLLIFYNPNNNFEVPQSLRNRNLRLHEENDFRKLQQNQYFSVQYYFDSFDSQNVYFKYAYSIQNYIYSSNINMRVFYFSKNTILLEFYNDIDKYFIQNFNYNFYQSKSIISTLIQGNIFECYFIGVNCKPVKNNIRLRRLHSYSYFAKYEIDPNEFKVFIINF